MRQNCTVKGNAEQRMLVDYSFLCGRYPFFAHGYRWCSLVYPESDW